MSKSVRFHSAQKNEDDDEEDDDSDMQTPNQILRSLKKELDSLETSPEEIKQYLKMEAPLDSRLANMRTVLHQFNEEMESIRKILGDVHGFTKKGEFHSSNILKEISPTTEEADRMHAGLKSDLGFRASLFEERGAEPSSTILQDIRGNVADASTARTTLVQNAFFPGFNAKAPNPLPGIREAHQLLQEVALAHERARHKIIPEFKILVINDASVAIMLDAFWWLWLDRWRASEFTAAKDQLFTRLSDSFVAFFCDVPHYVRDVFFKLYPHVLAHTLLVAFNEAFPDSYSEFDENMKNWIFSIVLGWITGLKPTKDATKYWPTLVMTSLPTMLQTHSKNNASTLMKASLATLDSSYDNDDLRRESKDIFDAIKSARMLNASSTSATIRNDMKLQHKSALLSASVETKKVLFNLCGRSPLLDHYIRVKGLEKFAGVNLYVEHSDIIPVSHEGKKTYLNALEEFNAATKKLRAQLEEDIRTAAATYRTPPPLLLPDIIKQRQNKGKKPPRS